MFKTHNRLILFWSSSNSNIYPCNFISEKSVTLNAIIEFNIRTIDDCRVYSMKALGSPNLNIVSLRAHWLTLSNALVTSRDDTWNVLRFALSSFKAVHRKMMFSAQPSRRARSSSTTKLALINLSAYTLWSWRIITGATLFGLNSAKGELPSFLGTNTVLLSRRSSVKGVHYRTMFRVQWAHFSTIDLWSYPVLVLISEAPWNYL